MSVKRCVTGAICCAALCMSAAAKAQAVKLAPPTIAPAESMSALLGMMEEEIVGAADAMPAEKYDFVPSGPGDFKGVRSFSSMVKHLAKANYQFFKPFGVPGAVDSKSIDALTTKDEIMKALRDSYTYAQASVNTITPENAFASMPGPPKYKLTRVSQAAFAMAHSMDHYGQMVEYLRMNGIIPPASRK